MDLDMIRSIFAYHPADTQEKMDAHAQVRIECEAVAQVFEDMIPDSPERTLAIRHLQKAMMFANSAIAQFGTKEYEEDN